MSLFAREPAGFDERTDKFLQWFKSLPGATFSDSIQIVDIRNRNAGRGIVATQDIAPETTLFTIPRKAIINVETSRLPSLLPSLFPNQDDHDPEGPQIDSWSQLILVMAFEHLSGSNSQWQPYLDVLPESFETPMFWSAQELNELQASALRDRIGLEEAEEKFRTELLPIIRAKPDVFTSAPKIGDAEVIQLLHIMGSTIMSYAFDLENDEEQEEDAEDDWVEDREGKTMMGMVPMADILNADAEFNAHVNHEENSLTVTALRHIKAGEEILNYYGPHPNSELLRRYGYVTLKHSRYDVVEIPWSIVEAAIVSQLGISDSDMSEVRKGIDEDEVEDTFVLERDTAEPTAEGLFSGPATLDDLPGDLQEQLKTFLKATKKAKPELMSDKRKRDEVQHAVLDKTLQNLQARYPTTIAKDELLLRQSDVSGRLRMAIEVRLGEKKLLQEARDALSGNDDDMSIDEPNKRNKRTG